MTREQTRRIRSRLEAVGADHLLLASYLRVSQATMSRWLRVGGVMTVDVPARIDEVLQVLEEAERAADQARDAYLVERGLLSRSQAATAELPPDPAGPFGTPGRPGAAERAGA